MKELRQTIEQAFAERATLDPAKAPAAMRDAVQETLAALDEGRVRVAEPTDSGWQVNEWVKKAVLLYFRLHGNHAGNAGALTWYDKVPLKYEGYDDARFQAQGARVVPPATVRFGAYISPDVVLMPSYVNLGAWIGPGTMVDTWATVGSCAQIGAGVHISGGAGIGGVLEPLQAAPTIVEDGCFIGARSEIVEGVIVERGAVISMGVFIGQSTPIYDRTTGEISHGRVPAGAVVVPGALPAADGSHSLSCAVIVKRVDERTRAKVGINELLRNAQEEDRG
jgi:2,3,4,5-tetrahydropyridine-2-carboxylate N-succinyltransferase